jgi:acylglycerol lipase
MVDTDLVLIHGFWSSPTTWDQLTTRMREDPDLRGLHIHAFPYESPKLRLPGSPARIPDYNDIAQSLPAYLATHTQGTAPVAIVTHSQGGLILQRYLAWMLNEGRGRELGRIQLIVMLSCPNEGAEYLRSIRAVTGFSHHPQAGQLDVLDREVGEARRIVLRQIVNATALDDRHCPIPVYVYSGRTDNIVLRESAQSVFPNAEVLPGDHFTILDPATPGHLTLPTLKRHLLNISAPPMGRAAEVPGRPSPASDVQLADKIEDYLTGVNNTRLYWQGWLPAVPATGVLLLCHGAGEHSGRYQNVVDTLAPDGWAVYGLDLRGHGRSMGEPVHVDRFSDWVDDFDRFRREVVSRHQDLPVFALGHCLGAQIALAYALDHQEALRGLVLSAPFLATAAVPGVVRPPGRVISKLLPRARFKLVGLDKISQDPEVVRRYRNDPLVYQGNATLTMARIVEHQFKILIERSRYLRIPVLIQHGAEDAIADPDGSRRLERAVGSPDRTFIPYDGLWNEIYNEPERQRPLGDLREWLNSHRSSPRTKMV